MTLRFRVKERKKWEELTLEQKVNVLKFKDEDPGLTFFHTFFNLMVIALFLTLIFATWWLYFQNTEYSLSYANVVYLCSKLTAVFAYMVVVGFGIDMYRYHQRNKKWKPFLNSLRKDKEVKF